MWIGQTGHQRGENLHNAVAKKTIVNISSGFKPKYHMRGQQCSGCAHIEEWSTTLNCTEVTQCHVNKPVMRGRQVNKEGKSLLNKLLRIFPNQNTTWKVSIPAMLTNRSCTAREGIPTMSVGIIWYTLRLQLPYHKPCKRPTAVLTSHVLRAGAPSNAWLHC